MVFKFITFLIPCSVSHIIMAVKVLLNRFAVKFHVWIGIVLKKERKKKEKKEERKSVALYLIYVSFLEWIVCCLLLTHTYKVFKVLHVCVNNK